MWIKPLGNKKATQYSCGFCLKFSGCLLDIQSFRYLINRILGNNTCKVWGMSNVYRVYRQFLKQLRYWAHLVLNARGLIEAYDK
jgi:hypothetical protein